MVDRPHDARLVGREAVGDRGRGVARAVVDDDDLECLGQAGERGQRFRHELLGVRRLVVGREEVREAGDPGGPGGRSTVGAHEPAPAPAPVGPRTRTSGWNVGPASSSSR